MKVRHGMTVWLKSGSPKMTVNAIARPGQWVCQWFVGPVLSHGTFNEEALTDTDPNEPKQPSGAIGR